MPRKAFLPDTIHDYDFKKLSRTEKNPRARLRMLGMFHLQCGKTITATAKLLAVRTATVGIWIKSFENFGMDGLYDNPKSGRKSKLTPQQKAELPSAIEELQNQKNGGRVIGLDIIDLVYERYGAKYTLDGIYTLLHKLNMSWVSARSKHPHSKLEDQEQFKKNFNQS